MPRLIFKCPYIQGGTKNVKRLSNYVKYVSTRIGVEKISHDRDEDPATPRQREMIRQLVNDFPESRLTFEYDDYQTAPTRAKAAEFISRALEENFTVLEKREIYIRYISERPRVQKMGAHGLFTDNANSEVILSRVMEEVSSHPGNVWTPIISLRREDAARLGYDNAKQWQAFLSSFAPTLAESMKIPLSEFRWYAAFHDEDSHPHIHMICYSTDPKKGFLTKEGIDSIRSEMANRIFRQDMIEIYQKQTQRRNELGTATRETLELLIDQIRSGVTVDTQITGMIGQLAVRLESVKGKKQYGYLQASLKAQVDKCVDELAKAPRIAKAYELWYEMREEVMRTYRNDMPQRLPLSQQKEFKSIKNMVIQEAVRLGEMLSPFCKSDAEEETADIADAFDMLLKSAQSGDPYAQYAVGKSYRDGINTEINIPQAAAWLWKSAEQGNAYASHALGKLLLDGGEGLPEDVNSALFWLQKSAEQNNPYAQYHLGKLLLLGDVIPKNAEQAVRLLTAAAEQGNQYAQYTLGKLNLLGKEVSENRDAAIQWFTMSANQGNEYAQYFLDHMDDWQKAAVSQGTVRLLHHLCNLLGGEKPSDTSYTPKITDRKLLRKIREKQEALGIKSSGHQQSLH